MHLFLIFSYTSAMTDNIQPRQSLVTAVEALKIQINVSPAHEGIVTDMLRSVFQRAKNAFDGIFDRKIEGQILSSLKAEYSDGAVDYKHLTPTDFPALSRVSLQTMEGFRGKYVDYTPVVLRGIAYDGQTLDEALAFYRQLVGSIITNKNSRSEWQDLSPRYKASSKARDQEDADNARYWVAGSHESVSTIGAVVSRLAELHALDKDAAVLASKLRSKDLKQVQARVNEITDLTKILADDLQKGTITGLSKAQINNLADGIMELAYQVEHFAVAVYRGHVYLNALKRLQKAVIDFK